MFSIIKILKKCLMFNYVQLILVLFLNLHQGCATCHDFEAMAGLMLMS